MPVCTYGSYRIPGRPSQVGERCRDEGVVDAVEVASEVGVQDERDDEESEDGKDGVARVGA